MITVPAPAKKPAGPWAMLILTFGTCASASPHDRQQQCRHGRIITGESQPILEKLHARTALGEVLGGPDNGRPRALSRTNTPRPQA
jgi:hypothetical protein